jgi:hypothetical protein
VPGIYKRGGVDAPAADQLLAGYCLGLDHRGDRDAISTKDAEITTVEDRS